MVRKRENEKSKESRGWRKSEGRRKVGKAEELWRRPVKHHQRYINAFTTFFFSNFPESHGEYEMLKVFQKWARVKEVFISKRLNRWGRRFGFVRFFDVGNAVSLERELDRCFIGNMKLHVNLPKYRRGSFESNGSSHFMAEKSRSGGGTQPHTQHIQRTNKEVWRVKRGNDVNRKDIVNQSYADAVRRPHNGFTTMAVILPWMRNSMVGRMMSDWNFELFQEECIRGGMNMFKVAFLGDNLVLLTPKSNERMEDIVKVNNEWFDCFFEEVKP